MSSKHSQRAAIVGAGLMGRWHADAVARVGGIVAVVVDPNLARAAALARRFPGSRAVDDLLDLTAADGIDVVHLCTPPSTHLTLATAALEAGAHVLVEKPLAPTARETADLIALARARDRLLCPTHQVPFQAGVSEVLGELHRLGRLVHVEASICSAGADDYPVEERDRIAGEVLPHPLSFVARLFDRPLPTTGWQVIHPAPGELRIAAAIEGVSVAILVSLAGRPPRHEIHLVGERASAYLDLFHGFAVIEPGATSRAYKVARPVLMSSRTALAAATNLIGRAARREPAYPGLRELVQRFYQATRGEREPPISAREIMDVALARDAILAAR
ncbi:MAG: Gfo/Idh/MocA family protein [Chloroflexota bacterium]